jgi:hypothetical protein
MLIIWICQKGRKIISSGERRKYMHISANLELRSIAYECDIQSYNFVIPKDVDNFKL